MCSMADRRPLVTPGKIGEIADADRAIVSGIVRTAAGDLTFEDPVTGSKTLAQLAAGGVGIGGSTGATDEALLRADGAGGSTVQASSVTLSNSGVISSGLIGAVLDPQASHPFPGAREDDTLWWTTGGDLYIGLSRIALAYEITEPTYITPTALAARADDYGPTGWNTATHVRQDVTGDQSISGFATAVVVGSVLPVQTKYLLNISTTNTLTLLHDSAFSSADNRIRCPGGVDFVMPPSSGVVIAQEPAPGPIWRVVSIGDTGGGGGIGGSTGANDNRVLRADGAGGATLQASPVTIDDAGAVTGVTSLTSSGNITLSTGNIVLSQAGATVDGVDLTALNTSVSGKITGPGGATDEAIVRFDGTSGTLTQNSPITISDAGVLTLPSSQSINMQTSTLVSLGYVTISPTAIAAQQNDYAPTGWSGADVVRVALTGNQTITGFSATATATRKVIVNTDATDSLTLPHESASSTSSNRIATVNGASLVIPPGGSSTIHYDATTNRWRPIEVNNGAVAHVPSLLHWVRRSVQLNNITAAIFPGYDTTLYSVNSTYWSYSAGTWTCNRAHVSKITAAISGQYSGAVSSNPYMAITYSTGGAYSELQNFETSIYSTTTQFFYLSTFATRSWAVGETMRVYMGCYTGDMDVFADKNICFIEYVSG
jgi:hypothetical protein